MPVGVLLGPYEALCAELMWFTETVRAARSLHGAETLDPNLRDLPRVSAAVQRRILNAGLLYGTIDTSALGIRGARLLDTLLMSKGIRISQREWEEEHGTASPFERFADTYTVSNTDAVSAAVSSVATTPETVMREIARVLRRLGIASYGGFQGDQIIPNMDVLPYVRRLLKDAPWPPSTLREIDGELVYNLNFLSRPGMLALGIDGVLRQSVESGLPLLSSSLAAPAWVQQRGTEPQYEVMKFIHSLPDGPALPPTFRSLQSLTNDGRLTGLREFVDFATNRILTAESDAISEVKKEMARVARTHRADRRSGQVAQAVTFISVPVGVAEALSGVVGPGLSLTLLGGLSQGLSLYMQRTRSRRWTSLP